MVVKNGGLTSKMLVLMGLIGNLYGIYMGCLDYLLVNIQKALENGHRNSEFSHENGDFPSFFVRLPEGTCSFHVPCMFQTVPEFVTFQDPGNLEALVAWRSSCAARSGYSPASQPNVGISYLK
jgi:hypothetical protein